MHYDFKRAQEFAWVVFVAAVIAVLQIVVTLQPEKVTDWRTWVVVAGGAAARAAAGAAIAWLTRPEPED